jgi:hypothetical protein
MLLRLLLGRSSIRGPARNVRRAPSLTLETLEDRCLLSGDIVLAWNLMALDALKNDSTLGADAKQAGPDRASRALAIVQVAVFDAVNSIDRSSDPYLVRVDAPADASLTAAAAQAAHDTLVNLFPDYQPALDAKLAADLGGVSSVSARNDGALVGRVAAAAILAARSNDGSDVPMNYTPVNLAGHWQPDPTLSYTQQALGPLWGNVTPFALPSAESFHVPPPPALTSAQYAAAFAEVKDDGGDGVTTPTLRTAEQTNIGIFWGYDNSPGLATPPRLYNQIAETIAVQQGNSPVENARFFALVNIALADAGIACWDGKFDYDFWRPVTAIRAADADGNPATVADPNWRPLGAPADNGNGPNFTPPFPAYASGHATFGGALFRMMADFYHRDNIHFTIHSDEFNGVTRDQNGLTRDPTFTRTFDSFSAAAEENGQSRIYLGIHWNFDKVQGIEQGTDIADYVFRHLLKRHHDGHGRQHDELDGHSLDEFRAVMTASGAVVLKTTDGKPFDSDLSTHTPSGTIATAATSTRDAATLTGTLIRWLNEEPWGGASRGGHVLEVNLQSSSGDLFTVF